MYIYIYISQCLPAMPPPCPAQGIANMCKNLWICERCLGVSESSLRAVVKWSGRGLGGVWGSPRAVWGILGCCGAVLEASRRQFGAVLGPSWGHLEAILGSSWPYLGSCWAHVGASWEHVGAALEHHGVIMGLCWRIWGLFLGILH